MFSFPSAAIESTLGDLAASDGGARSDTEQLIRGSTLPPRGGRDQRLDQGEGRRAQQRQRRQRPGQCTGLAAQTRGAGARSGRPGGEGGSIPSPPEN